MFNRLWVRMRRSFLALFLCSLMVCLWLSSQSSALSPQPFLTASAPQLVQQGVERYRAGDYNNAISLWKNALQEYEKTNNRTEQGIVLQNLARAYQQLGQDNDAISLWEQVIRLYRQLSNTTQVARALTEQAQAYSRIGQHRKAIALLCNEVGRDSCSVNSALQLALKTQDRSIEVAALGSLGNAYRSLGEYTAAQKNLEKAWQQAEQLGQPTYQMSVLSSLGILHSSLAQVSDRRADLAQQSGDATEATQFQQQGRQEAQKARAYLQQSLDLARQQSHALDQLRSLLSLIPIYYRLNVAAQTTTAWQQANQLLTTLPDSRDRVYAAIDLANLLQPNANSSQVQCLPSDRIPQAEALLQQAIPIARRLQDSRAASFALGELGRLYECQGNVSQALDFTQQARLAADQALDAKDSLYLWEWQTGRILKQQQRTTDAIAAYEKAIATLQSIRGDILTAARDIQFDFRDTIDPIYRELIALKLDQKTPVQTGTKSLAQGNSSDFRSILRTVDSLKLAELQNYFGSECVIAAVNQESLDLGAKTSAAVFSTIVLSDRTAVIVSLPTGQQQFTWIPASQQTITETINNYRRGLERARENYNPNLAQQIYDWIVRPFEQDLQTAQVNTLVFVQDGVFRTVPMASLHDGKQFLIQRYAVAITPSLTLTDPKPLDRENLRVLALGLTKETFVDGEPFPPLPNVRQELAGIRDLIPGSKKLLDEEFTRDRLKQELSETVYPILHIATHGKFATDPRETFIVTGDAQKLTFNELDQLIRRVSRNTEPLELLSLTACETAVGNDRSALGLAGVAVQAGARSAIASLWSVNDATTAKLATEFYAKLQNPQLSKAGALQAVQQEFITGKVSFDGIDATHPAYWSSFVLIGNWL
ncbi:MAG: CHAT domain-containing protein [Leptolyngbyaceae cyanobacterium bins.349]|nr:CHAT domain-containing protein [Leptolyngbyaceae cyanobacterium bins.349]